MRGLWLAYNASEEEVSDYWHGKFKLTFQQMIDEVEKHEVYADGALSEIKETHWKFFNGLTHTGSDQILRRNTEGYIEANYEEKELIQIARFINAIALLVGLEILNLAKSKGDMSKLENEFIEKIESYGNKP